MDSMLYRRFHSIARHLLVALIALGSLTRGADAAEPPGFPDTPSGRVARAYFDSFGAGEAEMRSFFTAHVSKEDLAERPIEARLARWSEMRDRFGALTPRSVSASEPTRLSVNVESEKSGTILMIFECRDVPPHTLVGVQIEATEDGGRSRTPPTDDTGPPPSDAAIVARLSSALDSLFRLDRFSGVAMLDKDGQALFAKAYGLASREAKRPITMETRFNIASIGKQFTAVAIRQLAAAGKLSLSDPVTRHLKDYRVANADSITIAMLLEHRAGVPDVFDSKELWEHPERARTAEDWYALVRDRPLGFKPGTRQRYSNGGFVVLGMVIERVSGEDYYAYLRRHVYAPAGMTRTDSHLADQLPADVALGYTRDSEAHGPGRAGAGDDHTPRFITEGFGRASAAGGNHSTAGDLIRYARALRAGTLLGREASDDLMGPGIGLGVAGGAPGKNALLELKGPYTLVILANQDPPVAEAFAETVGHMIARAVRGDARDDTDGRRQGRIGGPKR